jgi:molybdenum cofactor synthesis domain-containing protein
MRVALITVSDSVSQGARPDRSGSALRERCQQLGWQVSTALVVPDEASALEARLIELADSRLADVILTTGGTGVGPRDVTPEATLAVCEKTIPGLGELMREKGRQGNLRAALSRGIAGVRSHAVIVNLPGSPKGAVESLDAIAELLPHAVQVLRGARHD